MSKMTVNIYLTPDGMKALAKKQQLWPWHLSAQPMQEDGTPLSLAPNCIPVAVDVVLTFPGQMVLAKGAIDDLQRQLQEARAEAQKAEMALTQQINDLLMLGFDAPVEVVIEEVPVVPVESTFVPKYPVAEFSCAFWRDHYTCLITGAEFYAEDGTVYHGDLWQAKDAHRTWAFNAGGHNGFPLVKAGPLPTDKALVQEPDREGLIRRSPDGLVFFIPFHTAALNQNAQDYLS